MRPVLVYLSRYRRGDPPEDRIRKCASDFAARFGIAGSVEDIARTPRGKPFFPDAPEICFSVSHSGEIWACAISDSEVGADVQEDRPMDGLAIARRFFHPEEHSFISEHPACFLDVWAAKESYVKFTGAGINDEFSAFSVVRSGQFPADLPDARFTFVPVKEGYRLCVCTGEAREVKSLEGYI